MYEERHADGVDAKKGRTQPIRRVSGGRHVPFTSSRKRARPQVMAHIPPTPASRQHDYHGRQTQSSTLNPCNIPPRLTSGSHQTSTTCINYCLSDNRPLWKASERANKPSSQPIRLRLRPPARGRSPSSRTSTKHKAQNIRA